MKKISLSNRTLLNSNGITLIALIITIIILLILAGITVSTLTGDNGVLIKTTEAQYKTEVATYQEELDLSILSDKVEKYSENKENEESKVNATVSSDIKKYIPSFDKKYENELAIEQNRVVYIGNDENLYRMSKDMGILPKDALINDEILEELQPFITEWIVEAGDTIVLPLNDYIHNKYNFTVDYGDGTELKQVMSANDENAQHTYKDAGTYYITIKGNCPSFDFGKKTESKDKISKIVQWGNTFKHNYTNNNGLSICFKDCINLADPIPEPTQNTFKSTKSLEYMFYGCVKITKIPEKLLFNAPNITSLNSAFANCSSLENIPEKLLFNVPNITSLNSAFAGCSSLENIPEKLFSHCEKLSDFSNTFAKCSSLIEIKEHTFSNCYEATKFQSTFEGCSRLKKINKNIFYNCKKVTTFQYTFLWCTSLEEIPEDIFNNCLGVSTFYGTFYHCYSIMGNAPALWEKFPNANGTYCFTDSGFDNHNEIPKSWGGGGT